MAETPGIETLLSAVLLALASHMYFKRYEPTDLTSFFLLLGVLPAGSFLLTGQVPSHSISLLVQAVIIYTVHYCALLSSIALYRVSPWHPLAKYPGPLLCKLSKLWIVYMTHTGNLLHYYYQMHEQYGPIVRVGPNELSITEASLIPAIHGNNGLVKGPLWDGRRFSKKKVEFPEGARGNLIGARYKQQHADARRVWSRAFTTAAVKKYEPIVIRQTSILVEELLNRCKAGPGGKAVVNISDWLSYFAFDFMGDFAFGASFDLLRYGDKDRLVSTLHEGLHFAAHTHHVPWSMNIVHAIPYLAKGMTGLGGLARDQVMRRLREGGMHDDLFYHINDEGKVDGKPVPFAVLVQDSVTAIVAGSDTTGAALCNTIYCLLANPKTYKRLQAEVDSAFPPDQGEPTDTTKLAKMEYLNAVINETLRLHPPASTTVQRSPEPGSGGQALGPDFFVPEGTAVYTPPYVLHRDQRYFSPAPDTFWPERWLPEEKDRVTLNKDAYIPFVVGPTNCIGKPLALIEMRMVLAWLMQTFNFRFADGYDPTRWEKEMGDFLTLHLGKLPVEITTRV